MEKKWKADWIVDPRFQEMEPINLFHKELKNIELPHHPEDLQNQHMLVRKVFSINQPFAKARLDITADDYYRVYLNGQEIGMGPAPGYFFHYNYNQYDITDRLRPGKNVIAVDVYYQGLINRVWNSGDYRQGMIAEIFLDERLFLASDTTWKYKINSAYQRAPISSSHHTQFLEYIDARRLPRGWRMIDFDDHDWKCTAKKSSDDHDLYLQVTPSRQSYPCHPATVRKLGEGHYLADFGEELTGTFTMQAKGSAGTKVEIRYGEELDAAGNHALYQTRCGCLYQDFWTLSGEEERVEFFDYKGFRYVEVIGPAGAMRPETFAVQAEHYPFDDNACRFHSDHDLLNQIWTLCKRGVRNGSQEVYVDCPTREKGQYIGDSLISAHSQIYLTGDVRLLKKAITDFAISSRICPGLMAVAPGSLMQEIADYSLQWPMMLLMYYQHSGDREFLREMLPVAEKMLGYFKRYRRDDGLIESVTEKWNLVDWPDNSRDGYDFQLTRPVGPGVHNVLNAYYLGAIKTVNEIKDILRIDYRDEMPMLVKAFQKAFYRESIGIFVDSETSSHASQQSNILPLFFGFADEEQKAEMVEFLKAKRIRCSVYMAYFLLKALAKAEEYDYIFELLTSEDHASWATMVREGGTACFEAWGKDQKWNTSLCHPWASSPISVLIEDIAGIKPMQGWKKILFEPHIPAEIQTMELVVPTVYGSVRLIVRNGQIDFQTPAGIKIQNERSRMIADVL